MITTKFTTKIRCAVPLQLAGMGGMATPELVAAVSNAGALGTLGTGRIPPDVLEHAIAQTRKLTAKPIAVNFLIPFVERPAVEVAAQNADVVEFFYGGPDTALIELVHQAGALAGWQVGSADEARMALDAGIDLLTVQGIEASGHIRGKISLLTLLDQVLPFAAVPVIAAGGVGTARGMAAALAAGADAVRIGTRFLAARESGAHPEYVKALIHSGAEDTIITEAYEVLWPNAPHRVLKSCLDAAESLDNGPVGEMDFGHGPEPVPRYFVAPPNRTATGRVDAMALYAGESVSAVREIKSAAEIVHELVDGAEHILRDRTAQILPPIDGAKIN